MSYGQIYPPFGNQGADDSDPSTYGAYGQTPPLSAPPLPVLPQSGGAYGSVPNQPMQMAQPGQMGQMGAPDIYGASPSARLAQQYGQQIGSVWAGLPQRNLSAERNNALKAGLAGVLLGALTGNAAIGATAAGSAAQGAEQQAQAEYANQIQRRQQQAQILLQQQQLAQKNIGPELRYGASQAHNQVLAQNAAQGDLQRMIGGYPGFLANLRKSYPNASDTDLGQMAQNYIDQADELARRSGRQSSGLSVPTRVIANITPTIGATPPTDQYPGGQSYRVDSSGLTPTDAQGNEVPGIVHDTVQGIPSLAAARPPIIQQTSPTVTPDTSVADALALKKAQALTTYQKSFEGLSDAAIQNKLRNDKASGLLNTLGWNPPQDASGKYLVDFSKAAPLKAAPTPQDIELKRRADLVNERQQILENLRNSHATQKMYDDANVRLKQIAGVLTPGATYVPVNFSAMSAAEAGNLAARTDSNVLAQQKFQWQKDQKALADAATGGKAPPAMQVQGFLTARQNEIDSARQTIESLRPRAKVSPTGQSIPPTQQQLDDFTRRAAPYLQHIQDAAAARDSIAKMYGSRVGLAQGQTFPQRISAPALPQSDTADAFTGGVLKYLGSGNSPTSQPAPTRPVAAPARRPVPKAATTPLHTKYRNMSDDDLIYGPRK